MITVAILINGNPIMARSAVNTGKRRAGKTVYRGDDGACGRHPDLKNAICLCVLRMHGVDPEDMT